MSEERPMKIEWQGGLGAIFALIVVILCVILPLIAKLPVLLAILIGLTALSRLC